MSSHIRRRLCGVAALIVVAAACDVTNPGEVPFGSVITLVDSVSSGLGTARTFAMPDTVIELAGSAFSFDHANDQQVVDRVREHLVAMGWREVTGAAANPDVVVLNAASIRIETGVAYSSWFDTWGYLPYWGPTVDGSWAWGLPAGAVPYAFPAGTLITVMLDLRPPRGADTDKRIPLLWASAVDGLVNGSFTVERALDGLDQAFAQSPYLRIQ